MANEKWASGSVFELVSVVEVDARVGKVAFGGAHKAISDILTNAREAGVSDERLHAVRCWALFYESFEADLRRVGASGAKSNLLEIFQEKGRNLGCMLAGRGMGSAATDPEPGSTIGSTIGSLLEEEGITAAVEQLAEKKCCFDDALLLNVVKLMAKAGTRQNGRRAGWTVDEIQYGLNVIMPEVETAAIEAVLARLKRDGVAEDFNGGLRGIRVYALKDDYIDRLGWLPEETKKQEPGEEKLEALRADLRSTLQSNCDAAGKLTSWKLSALFYALQDKHPWVTRPVVAATASAEPGCSEVAPQVYEWTEVKREPSEAPRPTHAPRWAVECTPEQRRAIENEPGILAGSPPVPEAHIDEETPAGIVEMADAIYTLLRNEASGGQRRIWRDFDLHGLLWRSAELGVKIRDEHMTNPMIEDALAFLVAEGKLEAVPPSPERPWIRQPGWRVK
jgi:hypothetical protein